ncbi:MAG: GTP pyrophosphokinase [Bdellovibrionales bacterium GWB1_52_6]|nr:MAG: GTP pyrophosphokinase [Bdellovibrionales bacterium GWB1_52_6]OFZ04176.1 MAG: GTP pyrophosphokinase [Bdellovibrionales bacterium GWA1_52_35]HCM40521.1 GTP pyrophosphokinase [Bdellovibrionales bacterium]
MPKLKAATLQSICETISSYFPDAKLDLVKKAYSFAEESHRGQLRSSGEPYMIHPIEVAQTLADLRLDIASIATGLLHDTVEDTHATLEQLDKEFGKDVSDLVDGVTKLSQMTFKTSEEKQAENFRKMILAMAKDIRVILVKLADRLNNMRTLEHLAPHKQKIIAQETLDIYAPIANRLGMGSIKAELEDLCLRYLHPDVYYKLAQKVSKTKGDRLKYTDEVCDIIDEKLKEYDIAASVAGRAKHFYSIFNKMERRKVDFDQVYDIIAFRILVDNITECYKSLGVIHATYKPVPGRFKDYIAMPKANGYQSLHTTVIGPHGERVEIQIRTQEMNQTAEGGIAAHWKYKEGRFDSRSRENVEWVNRLLEWHKDLSDPNEFLETVKIDLFAEDVFVFTPRGEVKQLPHGSTPLDFAYSVHTDVGNKCVGAKINGKIVPLKYRLKSGDTIEIVTSPSQSPSKDWLKVVRSSRAKAKIRAFIKTQERERSREFGKSILDKILKTYSVSLSKVEKSNELLKAAQELSVRTPDELFVAVGYGRILPENVLPFLVSKEVLEKHKVAPQEQNKLGKAEDESFLKKVFTNNRRRSESRNAIIVDNLDDVLIRFGRCCNPLPGDSIVGFITRGRGVTVHTTTCTKALDNDQERKIDVQWNATMQANAKSHVKIRVLSSDEPGQLAMMSQAITSCGVNISSAHIRTTKDKKAIALFDMEVSDISQLQKVTSSLEGKKGIISVERVRS